MAKSAYNAPGLTVAEIEAEIANVTGWSVSDATGLAKIDKAITDAAAAICTWEGRIWWWMRKTGWFNTVAEADIVETADSGVSRSSNVVTVTTQATHNLSVGDMVRVSGVDADGFDGVFTVTAVNAGAKTFTYSQNGDDETSEDGTVNAIAHLLRSVNSASMEDAWAIESVYYDDDWRLRNIGKPTWDRNYTLTGFTTGTKPFGYAIFGEAPYIGVWPQPDSAYTIYVKYVRRHSKITSADSSDSALIVPAEYQMGIYVAGAIWLAQHDGVDPLSLRDCSVWMETVGRMASSAPGQYDENRNLDMFPDAVGYLPHDRKVIGGDGTLLIMNEVSV